MTPIFFLLGRWSILLALATVSVIPLAAQSVRGTLVEKATDRPIQGARMLLVAEGGTEGLEYPDELVWGLSAPRLRRGDSIGFARSGSASRATRAIRFTLAAGQPLTYHLSVPVRAIFASWYHRARGRVAAACGRRRG